MALNLELIDTFFTWVLYFLLVNPSHVVTWTVTYKEWNPILKNGLSTSLISRRIVVLESLKFIWLCEKKNFTSSTKWTRIQTQTIRKPRPYFCRPSEKRIKVERTYKHWITQLRPSWFKIFVVNVFGNFSFEFCTEFLDTKPCDAPVWKVKYSWKELLLPVCNIFWGEEYIIKAEKNMIKNKWLS